MILMLTKQPMSSFLALYRFSLGRNNDAIFALGDVGWASGVVVVVVAGTGKEESKVGR